MTQKQAAEFLGISRRKMTDLRNGRLGGFSLDLLFSLLGKLDYHIEIRVSPNSEFETSETISVAQI